MRPRLSLPLLLAGALAACVPSRVRVAYPASDDPAALAAAKALSQVYAVFPEEDADADLGAFAAAFEEALKARGGSLLAYRVSAPGPDPFLAELAPSAVLSVDLAWGPLQREEFQKDVKVKDKEGVERTEKRPFTRLKRRLDAVVSLRSPDAVEGGTLESVSAERSEEKAAAEALKVPEAAWMSRHGGELLKAVARAAAGAMPAPRTVTREREVFSAKEGPASKEASEKAFAGSWEEASALWAQRLEGGQGGWRELWNLAVAAEQRRAFAEAERLFRKAGDSAAGDPESAKTPFAEAAADAARAQRFAPRSEAAAAFFSRTTAVLPFSDDTTSVDGPLNLRRMTSDALRRGGWSVGDPDNVDARLRELGYSQGGQLARVDPASLSRRLGAERLFFGDVTQFRNVTLGFSGRREVEGSLRLWDAAAGSEVYRAERSVANHDGTSDAGEAAARLAGQLGKSLLENWLRKPLGAESAVWVSRVLQGLPMRPPAKR